MIDCLILGFSETNFEDYVNMLRSMGKDSGAFKDLDLAFIDYNDKPYRGLDILNHFHFEGVKEPYKPFHNADFMWPVVLYLGSFLAKRGFTFDYVNLVHLEKDKLREKLKENAVLTVAVTTTLYVSMAPLVEIMSFLKECNTEAKIIIGGPYIDNQAKILDDAMLRHIFKYIGADVYVINAEGEETLVNVISAIKNKSSLEGIDNIAIKNGNDYVMTPRRAESNSLEENMIDYTLFPKEEFGEFVSLRTAKSCPFACSFCAFPDRAGAYTYMDVGHAEKELNAIRDIGTVTTLTFIDDTFNVPKTRFKEILRMMIRNNYGFRWNSFYRSDQGDEETIELMAKAGCEGVFLGIESGSDTMLGYMNKTARRKHYLKAIPLLKGAGIVTHANFITGFPGETTETVKETIDFIEEARPDFFRAQLWYADPTTPIWRQKDQFGVKGMAFNWSHNTMNSKEACDWIDKIFLSVENSTWLPQFGFEDWSIYYLQRKGMPLDQIKRFIRTFNAIIKKKLIDPTETNADPGLIGELKQTCQFNNTASRI